MSKVIVVGGGPAGMLAAIAAAKNGNEVVLYEKNEKLGKKLFITGKGRCNVTNAADMESLFEHVVSNKKFLYSAFYTYTNQDVMELFERLGVPLKIERGERVFPVSDKSNDIIRALQKEMERLHISIKLNQEVKGIVVENGIYCGIIVGKDKKTVESDCVIITTGGLSYPITGSTGDGYEFAKQMGHTVTDIMPSLVPLEIKESFCKEMMGLSLKNVQVTIQQGKKQVYQDFGEMLFTHFGVSGPLILSASCYLTKYIKQKKELQLLIDLKPALSEEQLDDRIIRDFEKNRNKQFKNSLDELLPKKMIPVIINLSNIDPEKKVNTITKEERKLLVSVIKGMSMTIKGFRGYNEAIITKGGISVKEINPSTMESKLVPGVFFAGEVLDLDALTGGYNLQIAWSTSYVAGTSVYDRKND